MKLHCITIDSNRLEQGEHERLLSLVNPGQVTKTQIAQMHNRIRLRFGGNGHQVGTELFMRMDHRKFIQKLIEQWPYPAFFLHLPQIHVIQTENRVEARKDAGIYIASIIARINLLYYQNDQLETEALSLDISAAERKIKEDLKWYTELSKWAGISKRTQNRHTTRIEKTFETFVNTWTCIKL